jgi:hypothetical protein
MANDKNKVTSRRNFFRAVGGASTVGVASAAAALGPSPTRAYEPGDDEAKARYRETDHVKAFYRVSSYPPAKK